MVIGAVAALFVKYPTALKVGERLSPYLAKSMREVEGRWTPTFDPAEVLRSEEALNGDHWREWLSHDCQRLSSALPIAPSSAATCWRRWRAVAHTRAS